jgi:hypothetical protein
LEGLSVVNLRLKHGFLVLVGGATLLLIFFFWIGGGFISEKRNKYLVPIGYAGWVCIAYGIPDATPLSIDADGYQVVRVPSSGIVKTSTKGKAGPLKDVYYMYRPDGTTESLPAGRIGGGGTFARPSSDPGVFASYFWISDNPKEDYQRAGSPSSDSLRGRCF